MSRRAKVKADCRADTRGKPWAGIPLVVIQSAAYRDCSVHARAILVELVARLNGYNNGQIAVSERELRDALRCSPRKVVTGIVELMEHGLLDVAVEGRWKERMARQYRLTFVTTKNASATNDYLRWTPEKAKSGVTDAVAEAPQSATDAVTGRRNAATDAVTEGRGRSRKTANSQKRPATDAVTLISKPYVVPENRAAWFNGDPILGLAILALGKADEPLAAAA